MSFTAFYAFKPNNSNTTQQLIIGREDGTLSSITLNDSAASHGTPIRNKIHEGKVLGITHSDDYQVGFSWTESELAIWNYETLTKLYSIAMHGIQSIKFQFGTAFVFLKDATYIRFDWNGSEIVKLIEAVKIFPDSTTTCTSFNFMVEGGKGNKVYMFCNDYRLRSVTFNKIVKKRVVEDHLYSFDKFKEFGIHHALVSHDANVVFIHADENTPDFVNCKKINGSRKGEYHNMFMFLMSDVSPMYNFRTIPSCEKVLDMFMSPSRHLLLVLTSDNIHYINLDSENYGSTARPESISKFQAMKLSNDESVLYIQCQDGSILPIADPKKKITDSQTIIKSFME